MTLLPIIERELRVGSRNKQNYIARSVVAGSTAVMLGIFLLSIQRLGSRGLGGRELFQAVTLAGMMWSLIAGLGATCDCLSSEKREGTLGLLFLTHLSSLDIILGKLAVASLNSTYAFLACVPALMIPVILGGLNGSEIVRSLLALGNALFFAMTAGILCSAVFRDGRKAPGCFVLLSMLWIPPFQAFMQRLSTGKFLSPVVLCLTWLNPGHALSHAFLVAGNPVDLFWGANAVTFTIGLLFLLAAGIVLPHTWREGTKPGLRTWFAFWKPRALGSPGGRLGIRRSLLQPFPIQWLLCRRPWPWFDAVLTTLFFNGIGLAIALRWHDRFDVVAPALGGAIVGQLIWIKLKCAHEASDRWLQDRNSGALEMLLSTPLTVSEIIEGQRRGLFRMFAASVLLTFFFNAIFCGLILRAGSMGINPPLSHSRRIAVVVLILLPTLMMVADLMAFSMVGIWSGVKTRRTGQSSAIAISSILGFPWLVTWVFGFLIPVMVTQKRPSFAFVLGFWLIVGMAADVIAYCWAEHRLLTQLRVAATQRHQPSEGAFWSQCQNWLAKRIRRG